MNDTTPQEVTEALQAQADYYDEQSKRQSTPMDAKNKAISDLTAACYQKASQLQLSKEEVAGLSADFGDECFQPGAAGKENLIYIEHASLRERLDQVIGMGQWCIVPIRRWEEPFLYKKDEWVNNRKTGNQIDVKGSHVYVDGIMLIRGAFVASAIGEMTYYPDSHAQNYGDAVEGAETAALRRCCKRLGIGLQAWRKDWCAGWWARKNTPKKPVEQTAAPKPSVDTPKPTTKAPEAKTDHKTATIQHRMKALNNLFGAPGEVNRGLVSSFLRSKKWIVGDQEPEAWNLQHVPTTLEGMQAISKEVAEFERTQREQVQP